MIIICLFVSGEPFSLLSDHAVLNLFWKKSLGGDPLATVTSANTWASLSQHSLELTVTHTPPQTWPESSGWEDAETEHGCQGGLGRWGWGLCPGGEALQSVTLGSGAEAASPAGWGVWAWVTAATVSSWDSCITFLATWPLPWFSWSQEITQVYPFWGETNKRGSLALIRKILVVYSIMLLKSNIIL